MKQAILLSFCWLMRETGNQSIRIARIAVPADDQSNSSTVLTNTSAIIVQMRAVPYNDADCNSDWPTVVSALSLKILQAFASTSSTRRDLFVLQTLGSPDAEIIANEAQHLLGSLRSKDVITYQEFLTALPQAINLLPPGGPPVALTNQQAASVGRLLAALSSCLSVLGAKAVTSGRRITFSTVQPDARSAQSLIDAFQRLAVATMRGRGAGEQFSPATGDAGAWLTVKRMSLDTGAELSRGSVPFYYLCNISDPTPGGGGGCSRYDESAVLVLPSAVRNALITQYVPLQPGACFDIAVTAFALSPFRFAGAGTDTYGPSIRLTFLRALNATDNRLDPTLSVMGLTNPLMQAS
jgi:hypothetical protein